MLADDPTNIGVAVVIYWAMAMLCVASTWLWSERKIPGVVVAVALTIPWVSTVLIGTYSQEVGPDARWQVSDSAVYRTPEGLLLALQELSRGTIFTAALSSVLGMALAFGLPAVPEPGRRRALAFAPLLPWGAAGYWMLYARGPGHAMPWVLVLAVLALFSMAVTRIATADFSRKNTLRLGVGSLAAELLSLAAAAHLVGDEMLVGVLHKVASDGTSILSYASFVRPYVQLAHQMAFVLVATASLTAVIVAAAAIPRSAWSMQYVGWFAAAVIGANAIGPAVRAAVEAQIVSAATPWAHAEGFEPLEYHAEGRWEMAAPRRAAMVLMPGLAIGSDDARITWSDGDASVADWSRVLPQLNENTIAVDRRVSMDELVAALQAAREASVEALHVVVSGPRAHEVIQQNRPLLYIAPPRPQLWKAYLFVEKPDDYDEDFVLTAAATDDGGVRVQTHRAGGNIEFDPAEACPGGRVRVDLDVASFATVPEFLAGVLALNGCGEIGVRLLFKPQQDG